MHATTPLHPLDFRDGLGYLLGRAWFLAYADLHRQMRREGLGDAEFLALLTLLACDAPDAPRAVDALLAGTGFDAAEDTLERLHAHGLIRRGRGNACLPWRLSGCRLSHDGRALALKLAAAARNIDRALEKRLAPDADASLRQALARLTRLT